MVRVRVHRLLDKLNKHWVMLPQLSVGSLQQQEHLAYSRMQTLVSTNHNTPKVLLILRSEPYEKPQNNERLRWGLLRHKLVHLVAIVMGYKNRRLVSKRWNKSEMSLPRVTSKHLDLHKKHSRRMRQQRRQLEPNS